ncbi:MAG: GPR endopeptidase [Clostridia bacterium]|nr:GPR endopeptidase [Clostridia bacterium]
MNKRTDLALENVEMQPKKQTDGVRSLMQKQNGVRVSAITIFNEAGARALGKPQGNYVTLELPDRLESPATRETARDILSQQLQRMLPERGTVLVVGLGNENITPDALGPKCVSLLFATRHITGEVAKQAGLGTLRAVAAIAPGVLGQTGIETAEIIESLVQRVQPQAVLVIDALASCRLTRLGTTIQLTDTGIAPGSGVGNRRVELSARTLGVPVIAIGIPTVVDATTLALDVLQANGLDAPSGQPLEQFGERLMMVTPKEVDLMIDRAAETLAMGINHALQPELSEEELLSIVK